MASKVKYFKDPVHGYIQIPADWCTHLVDTRVFQRLRGIQQSSLRPLYPAASHDRFIHSLGTFHLANLVYQCLKAKSTHQATSSILADESLRNTFLIASLMHDCGHAPFSHTLECFYNYDSEKTSQRAMHLLFREFPRLGSENIEFDCKPH